MSSSSGQLSASVRSEVLLSCRRPRLELIASGSRREAPRGSPPEPQGDFLSYKSCAPWHALSARPGPGACLPGGCLHHWPISSRGPGARPREPLPPQAPTHGAQLDSGQRAGMGEGAVLCLLPHPTPSRARSQQLSVPQRASPSQKSPVWLRSGCRGQPCLFLFSPGICSDPFLVA